MQNYAGRGFVAAALASVLVFAPFKARAEKLTDPPVPQNNAGAFTPATASGDLPGVFQLRVKRKGNSAIQNRFFVNYGKDRFSVRPTFFIETKNGSSSVSSSLDLAIDASYLTVGSSLDIKDGSATPRFSVMRTFSLGGALQFRPTFEMVEAKPAGYLDVRIVPISLTVSGYGAGGMQALGVDWDVSCFGVFGAIENSDEIKQRTASAGLAWYASWGHVIVSADVPLKPFDAGLAGAFIAAGLKY